MTLNKLKKEMVAGLDFFNTSIPAGVTDQTQFSAVLDDNDGFGTATSKRLYKGIIRRRLIQEGHADKAWPADWISLNVSTLAPKIH